MYDAFKLKIEMLEGDQLRDYFPDDFFFTLHDFRFGHHQLGKSLLRSGREISVSEKKEILEATEISVLRICFVNQSDRAQKLSFAHGPFRVERIDPIISERSGKRIQSKQIFQGEYKRAEPVTRELQSDDQLCFDLVAVIDANKLVFPWFEYELQRGQEYLIQVGNQSLRSNQISWWFPEETQR